MKRNVAHCRCPGIDVKKHVKVGRIKLAQQSGQYLWLVVGYD